MVAHSLYRSPSAMEKVKSGWPPPRSKSGSHPRKSLCRHHVALLQPDPITNPLWQCATLPRQTLTITLCFDFYLFPLFLFISLPATFSHLSSLLHIFFFNPSLFSFLFFFFLIIIFLLLTMSLFASPPYQWKFQLKLLFSFLCENVCFVFIYKKTFIRVVILIVLYNEILFH